MEEKCVFCEWVRSTREEKDNCRWIVCQKCQIKSGLKDQE